MAKREKRGKRSFARENFPLKELRPRVIIVAEGVSEQNYLEKLCQSRWSEKVVLSFYPQRRAKFKGGSGRKGSGKGRTAKFPTDVSNLIKIANDRANDERGVPIWIVCDGDTYSAANEKRLDNARRSEDIYAAISNPCIEYWFLCVVGKTPRVSDATEAYRELRKIITEYEKPAVGDQLIGFSNEIRLRAMADVPETVTASSGWPPLCTSTMPLLIEWVDSLVSGHSGQE